MKNIVNSEVDTPDGKATIKEIYVTELGYIMVKIQYPSRGNVFINHNIAQISDLLDKSNITLTSRFPERITIEAG